MRIGPRSFARLSIASVALAMACVLLGRVNHAKAAVVTVDPTKMTNGYMFVSELPSNGGAADFNQPWGAADLESSFSGSTVTVSPNTSIDRDVPTSTYWWQDASGTSPGNKIMDALLYAENQSITDTSYTFNYNVLSNTLVAPYTSVGFVKAFGPSFSYYIGDMSAALNPGPGSITFPGLLAGDVVQYGFETIGPDARLAQEASLGSAVIAPVAIPEPTTMLLAGAGAMAALAARRRRA
ncbi:MAG: PEP-CTERM sorting domain-containing protein [Tepidisphaeraceae bacterium]